MKRTLAILRIFLALIAFVSLFNNRSDADVAAPTDMTTVELHSDKGWMLWVWSDGSAKVQYGSGPLDNAKAPQGTVDFTSLQDSLRSALSIHGAAGGSTSAAIRAPRQKSVTLRRLQNNEIWNHVIAQLEGRLQSIAQKHFEELVAKVPMRLP